ncbi:hypothetical protein V496_08160 [Pseudogymnoascus sp. VKM F-4515 (FW-2607)]|nr:hypothetical protein V496_08160 [Pseudogymnoascus sp. VKM F-4515 (FW-2607)]KFY98828.1 hypothetical protein V498_01193 [Pseudogymnoascus sp. VKM F-4517 (FW-2822)]
MAPYLVLNDLDDSFEEVGEFAWDAAGEGYEVTYTARAPVVADSDNVNAPKKTDNAVKEPKDAGPAGEKNPTRPATEVASRGVGMMRMGTNMVLAHIENISALSVVVKSASERRKLFEDLDTKTKAAMLDMRKRMKIDEDEDDAQHLSKKKRV